MLQRGDGLGLAAKLRPVPLQCHLPTGTLCSRRSRVPGLISGLRPSRRRNPIPNSSATGCTVSDAAGPRAFLISSSTASSMRYAGRYAGRYGDMA
jgi:hypothetical protein